MSNLRVAIVFAIGLSIGYQWATVENDHAVCGNYATKYSNWYGWLSVKDGVYRCFWIESEYPNRVRQGIKDIK